MASRAAAQGGSSGKDTNAGSSARTLADKVADSLRNAVLDGTLRGGERLRQADLADELGVSPIPVREALRKLETEGFVAILPYRGALVAPLSLDDLHEGIEIQIALQTHALRLAYPSLTAERLEQAERMAERLEPVENVEAWNGRILTFLAIVLDAERRPRLFDLIREQQIRARRYLEIFVRDVLPVRGVPLSFQPLLVERLRRRELEGALTLMEEDYRAFELLVRPEVERRLRQSAAGPRRRHLKPVSRHGRF
jgi:DNA-binding GntR family transcriptional regulator